MMARSRLFQCGILFGVCTEGVVDLGAGNGILGIGALLLGAPRVTFVEARSKVMLAM